MKRFLSLLLTVLLTCSALSAQTITVSPSNPRMYSRFIYNYRSVLQDFEIDPDISRFVSPTGAKSFPAFVIKGNDNLLYVVSAADIVAFADKVEVTISDSASKASYPDLEVINVSEKLNLAVTRLPKDATVNALDIDSVWFNDESEQYSTTARMFLKSVPMVVSGDESTLSVLYNRLVASAPEGYYYILPNLSYKYLYGKTADQIADGIEALSEEDYQLFRQLNSNGDLISAMRLLAGDMAAKCMKQPIEPSNTIVKENSVVLEGKNGEYITFVQEFGVWRLIADSKPNAAATTNTATYISNNSSYSQASPSSTTTSAIEQDVIGTIVRGKVMIPYDFRDQGVSGSFSIGYAMKFMSFEAVFEYNSLGIYRSPYYTPDLRYNDGLAYNSDYHYSSFIGIGIRFGGFVPVNINEKLTLAPNVKFEWITPFPVSYAAYFINAISPMVGVDLLVRMSRNNSRFFVGFQYEQKFFLDYKTLSLKNNTMGYFDFSIGFIF